MITSALVDLPTDLLAAATGVRLTTDVLWVSEHGSFPRCPRRDGNGALRRDRSSGCADPRRDLHFDCQWVKVARKSPMHDRR